MEERSALSDRVSDGHVLVQFYGNHPRYCSVYFIPGSFLDLPNPAYWLYFVDLQCLDWSSNRCFSFWGCELNPCPTLCFCKHKFRVFRSHCLVFAFWWRNLYLMNKTTSRGGGVIYNPSTSKGRKKRARERLILTNCNFVNMLLSHIVGKDSFCFTSVVNIKIVFYSECIVFAVGNSSIPLYFQFF